MKDIEEKRQDLMVMLEEMITELPQYRKITNEMCNTYISDYVRNEFESRQIKTGDNNEISYCWDIYSFVPIDFLEKILDFLKELKESDSK